MFTETLFLGGGLSCLSAALRFCGDGLVLEKEDRVGGLCRSTVKDGFVFDYTGHLLHLRLPEVRALVKPLLRGGWVDNLRDTWIQSHGVFTRYPFQSHFFGLPSEVASECLLAAIEAARRLNPRRRRYRSFADWVLSTLGQGVARHFMFPYNRKLWTVAPQVLTTEWLGRFVPRPRLDDIVRGALSDAREDQGYNAHFLYPKRGGIESVVRALADRVACPIETGAEVRRIDLERRVVWLSSGDPIAFGRLVSSLPLPELIRRTIAVPDSIRRAARALRWSSVYNLNLGIRSQGVTRHWVYVPEERVAFYRYGYADNFSPGNAPSGAANVYTEVAYRGRAPDFAALEKRVISDLVSAGVMRSRRDIWVRQTHHLPYAYAIYDHNRTPAVRRILRFLESREVFSIGRYGRWEYASMEDAIQQGLETAALLNHGK